MDSRYVQHSEVDDIPVDGVTTDPISSNWAYDHENAPGAHHNYGFAQVLGEYRLSGGTDTTGMSAADITLARFPAANSTCYATFSFIIPQNAPSAKTWTIRLMFATPTSGDAATFNYYVSSYGSGDAYSGWNIINNVSWGTVTTTAAYVRITTTKELTGKTFDAGDIVTVMIRKTSVDTRDFHLVSVEMYYA